MIYIYESAGFGENDNEFTIFTDRMKYLCDQKSILTEVEFNTILSLIPADYRDYLIILGVDRIKANGYGNSRCEREFDQILMQQIDTLKSSIHLAFKPGDKYSRAEIKKTLADIYTKVGYDKTPKANDLGNWFEIKDAQWYSNGKKIQGFEIVKVKQP